MFGLLAFCFLLELIEVSSYLVLFHHLYHHDNQVVKSILRPEVIKLRNKKNAISFLGQLSTWILETLYTLLLIYFISWRQKSALRELASFIKLSEFTLIPLVQILCTPPLRAFVLKKNFWFYVVPTELSVFYMVLWLALFLPFWQLGGHSRVQTRPD